MNPHQTHLLCRALELAHGISTVLAELRTTTDDRQPDDPAPCAGCDPPVSGDAAPGLFAAGGDRPCVVPVEHVVLTRRQWHALDDVLAEMCERTGGSLEDLHDRGRGVLEFARPAAWDSPPTLGDEAAGLWRAAHRVVGALAHLEDAAPDDRRALRTAAADLDRLARDMAAFGDGRE